MQELASELDLHYEIGDGPRLTEPLTKLHWGAGFLTNLAVPVPGVVIHILTRFPVKLG